ncbi:MAG: serine hydrolase [Candidatus Eiseniibacteriota bacterium]|jgi:hypothetical protein
MSLPGLDRMTGHVGVVITVTFLALASLVPLPASAVDCETDALGLLLENDGQVGMYLKRVGGPVLGGYNESTVFEPASAIKVLVHAHALRQVQDGFITLDTDVDWTRDLDEDECGSHPCNVSNPQAESDPLDYLLEQMMTCSDNRHTHALRTLFTDTAILATGATLGMTDTDFNHIIGCPTCDTFNEITLVDLGRVYEGVTTGFLDEERQTLFHDLMLNETNSGFGGTLNAIVDDEVANQGLDPQVADDFKALIRFSTKGGSYTLGEGCVDPDDTEYRSIGGIVELPTSNGAASCEYVFGAWMNAVPEVVQGTGTVAAELLRLAICEALATWDMVDVDMISASYDPPNPWGQEDTIVDTFTLEAGVDLYDIRFLADPLQCQSVSCEPGEVRRLAARQIEFVPAAIGYLPAGEPVTVEVKTTIPIGQHACNYEGALHVVAETDEQCTSTVSEQIDYSLILQAEFDVDVADNLGNLSENTLRLVGSKNELVTGTFTVINPNSTTQNVDPDDGPGNRRIDPIDFNVSGLVKVGDPAVEIPAANISVETLVSLGAGDAQQVDLMIDVPDGIPVNALYAGTVEVVYQSCLGFGPEVSDTFAVELEVRPTQGTLDILQADLEAEYCPEDPWTRPGLVELLFDIHALGDHRNVRVSSGGLCHETIDTKIDQFDFFSEEYALIAAGETRGSRVVAIVPPGQHAGLYEGNIRVVSENGGEDSVRVRLEICPVYDLDIKDGYANLDGNVMEVQAIARANASGGEWAMRAFDIGLPADWINNRDEFDGPGNAPIDCIECEFGEWSPAWRGESQDRHLHTNFRFTGVGSVSGQRCDVESGQFRRLLVSLFVPPMQGGDNHPGTYRGRLDCAARVADVTVSHDFFDIEVELARIVGPEGPLAFTGTFGAHPTAEGARIYWGDFAPLGMHGTVNLYREDPATGTVDQVGSGLAQRSSYVDASVEPGTEVTYRLGIEDGGREVMLGPVTVGATPRFFQLSQNAPNPFRRATSIRYDLVENGPVSLKIYDVGGRLVRTLVQGEQLAGVHAVDWDRRGQSGQQVASGIYYYNLTANGTADTKKMVIVE